MKVEEGRTFTFTVFLFIISKKIVYKECFKFYFKSVSCYYSVTTVLISPRAKEMTSLRSCVRRQSVEKALFYTVSDTLNFVL